MQKQHTLVNTLLGLCLLSTVNATNAAEEELEAAVLPDLEMLEFLGQFATDEGNWVDPDSLLSDEFEQFLDAAIENAPQETGDSTDLDNN